REAMVSARGMWCPDRRDCFRTRAVQFVFPTHQRGFWKKLTQSGEHLAGGFEGECQRARAALDFGRILLGASFVLHAGDFVIAQRRDLKERSDVVLDS